tara:strand:- start:104 stop:370 length:267 start_codon:yes stop_codon:yes gene_type:complete
VWIFIAVFSGYWVVRGVNAIRNADHIAQSNADHIASGREEYFEQRRSWREWNQTPPTNAATIEQAGKRDLIWGLFGLIIVTPFLVWID